MDLQEISERSKLNANTYRLISYGLVALMLACAAVTVVGLAGQLIAGFQPYYLILLCFIVALDRLYSYRAARDLIFLSREWLILFGTHLIVLVTLAKIMVGISQGWAVFLKEIPTWRENLLNFVNYETMFALVLVFATWLLCGEFAEMLEEIGPEQIQYASLELVMPDPKHRIPVRTRLIKLLFWLGAFLVFLTMLGRVLLRSNFEQYSYDPTLQVPILAAGGAGTLLYFMFGLALLSQTQFISLHMRWNIQKIPINGMLARQWAGYSLLFLSLIALVVSLLPTSYSLQSLGQLGNAIKGLTGFNDVALKPIIATPQPTRPYVPAPTPTPSTDAPPLVPPNLEWLQTLVFWGIFLAVIFFGIRQYLLQNQELLQKLRTFSGWRLLVQFWNWLKSLFVQVKNIAQIVVNFGRERAHLDIGRPSFGDGYINPRKLTPRQKIYFFYLAFIRRAGESGLPRSSDQTPEEYASTLQSALPESAPDIHALTEAFNTARYSRQSVEKEQSQRVESIWARVRKALRGKRSTR